MTAAEATRAETMLIEVRERRMLVVSDMHVGYPFSEASGSLGGFFDYARRERFNVCINGDGLEILQVTFSRLARDAVDVLGSIRSHLDAGLKVYYVIGNHDIVLEQFLHRWSGVGITPFLNVDTGTQRIRIEHGHLYDPSFMRSPRRYELMTRMAGPFLRIYPDVYRAWAVWESLAQRARAWRSRSPVEHSVYYLAADMLLRRGFDIVVFGHTHGPEDIVLENGGRYINCGNWVRGGSFVEICGSRVALKHWNGGAPQVVASAAWRVPR